MNIERFEKWRKNYTGQLESEQFIIAAKGVLATTIEEAAMTSRVENALKRLHENPARKMKSEILLSNMIEPEKSDVIKTIAFRGEHGDGEPLQTKRGAYSFGSKEVASTYASSPNDLNDIVAKPRLLEAEITIYNPVINDPDDPFIDCKKVIDCVGQIKALTIFDRLSIHIENTNNFEEVMKDNNLDPRVNSLSELVSQEGVEVFNSLYMDAYPIFDEPEFVSWFSDAGYDGLVQGGNGESSLDIEYKVFNKDQVNIIDILELSIEHKVQRPNSESYSPDRPIR